MFQKPNPKQSFPLLEEEIVQYWKEQKTFEKSLEKNKGRKEYVFYDGPPFATGLPHYGHILAGTLKDVIPRYQTMRGYYVPRNWGWDCHGLPIENLIEKDLGLEDKQALLEFGIDNFNEKCRASVLKYAREWKKTVTRMGRWVDMEDCYKTMDSSFMESVWWVFKSLWDKGLVYQGNKAMHICPRCVTPLSNFEVGQGYKDITDLSVTWKFKLKDQENTFVLAWTTTPWSTLSTMGLSIGPDFDYVKVRVGDEHIIFAKERLEFVMKGVEDYEIVDEFKGKKLVGAAYEHIMDWYKDTEEVSSSKTVYHIYAGDYVEVTEGTGIVTINGAYGEIDLEAAQKNDLPTFLDVEMTGTFTEVAGPFAGMNVKKAEPKIAEYFQEKGLVWRTDKYKHSYPHCWRCDTGLLNYSTKAWFVNIDKIKKKMLKANSETSWMPAHLRDGRFGNWLENARDWCISRNRYWGAPLPVWRSESGETECLGSFADLRARVPERFTKITLVRHGQSEGNTVGLRQAVPPGTGLTALGKQQAKAAGKACKAIHKTEPFDLILHSPLLRTQETAELIAKEMGAKLELQVEELVREIDFGKVEGKRDIEIKDYVAKRHQLGEEEHYNAKCGETGESHHDVTQRALNFVQKMIKEQPGKSILVVTHSDIIRLLLREVEGKSLEYLYENGHYPMGTPKELYFDNVTGKIVDLHKHFMDEVTYPHPKTGEEMRRVEEVLDCWFESGSMPYAQAHYPFENKERFEATFPANFIAEGLDQTRGWFYTLTVLSSALFEKPAFQNVIVNGIVLAEDGRKMSKRLQNYPPPEKIMNEYGADAMRVYLMHSPVVKADDLRFSEKGVEEVVRQTFLPLWNAYSFLLTYAELDEWKPSGQIYFVRHGQTELNKQHRIQGSMDEPLNDHGRDQVEALRNVTKNLPVDVIVTSDYQRAKQTADILNADHDLEIEVVADLREHNFGELEGKSWAEVKEGFKKGMNPMLALHSDPPGGEKFKAFEGRVWKAYQAIQEKHAGKNVLLVAHGGVYQIIRKNLLGLKKWEEFYAEHFHRLNNAAIVPMASTLSFEPSNKLDQWIISEINVLTKGMTEGLDHYDLAKGLDPLVRFIDSLTNWYIRRSRRRFWKSESDTDKAEAYQTLYTVLVEICKLLAPFAPFMTEAMYRNLTGLESVHLADWPEWHQQRIDEALNQEVETTRQIVALGHAARSKAKIKVRQPLGTLEVALPPTSDLGRLTDDQQDIIKEELNIKELTFLDSVEGKVKVIVKPNGKLLGPKLGAAVQDVIREAKAGNYEQLDNGNVKVLEHELSPEEIEIAYQALDDGDASLQVESDQGVVVLLHTELTPELTREGYARDMVRAIQNLRKEADLNVSDHIKVGLTTDFKDAQDAIAEFQDYIRKETLATEITAEKRSGEWESVIELDGHGLVVSIEKA